MKSAPNIGNGTEFSPSDKENRFYSFADLEKKSGKVSSFVNLEKKSSKENEHPNG